ncbi:head-tail connector protein [Streptomyces similanensis]|uniref:Head-to-tail adaptor n=1 Tax=Streptomyces similanensis TaxID=1274988 RepID=A0ABP9LLJ9_9ACTN
MAYATVEEFAEFLDPDPVPVNAARLLERASTKLDRLLMGAVYKTDDDSLPLDPALAAVFRKAVCIQAQYIDSLGDETGAMANVSQMSLGNQQIVRALSVVGSGTPRVSPDLVDLLRTEGLLPIRPYIWG